MFKHNSGVPNFLGPGLGTALHDGTSRDRFPMSPLIFPVASDSSMCPGDHSASRNGYENNYGVKAVGS